MDFENDPAIREALNERLKGIETEIDKMGLRIGAEGSIGPKFSPARFGWKTFLIASAFFFFRATWAYVLAAVFLRIAFRGYFTQRAVERALFANFARLQCFIVEREEIRARLFARWRNWQLDESKLDAALNSVIDAGALSFFNPISVGSIDTEGCFRVNLPSDTYRFDHNFNDMNNWGEPGTVSLCIEGKLHPSPDVTGDSYWDEVHCQLPYVVVTARFCYGENGRHWSIYPKYDVIKSMRIRIPSEVFRTSWPRAIDAHQTSIEALQAPESQMALRK